MRKLLRSIIPAHWISQRKFYQGKIFFESRGHLNLFFNRSYEKEVWDTAREKLQLDVSSKIIDIGANIGQSMLSLNKLFPNNIIDCYEPQHKEFCFLEFNRFINSVPGKSYNYAIVGEEKKVFMTIDNKTGGRSSMISSIEDESSINLPIKTFKSLLDEKIGLIKIDIEGFENRLFTEPYDSLNYISLIVEVRETTSEQILNYFLPSHNIYHIKEKRYIKELETIGFADLLITPKN